jgi:1-acyl-sn-glycerol-3-phosphate acyltransferase
MNKTIKNNKNNKKDIIVNYTCYCGNYFYNNEEILYMYHCCHIIHKSCFNIKLLKNIIKCPLCNNNVKRVLTEKKILLNDKYIQEKIDLKSIRFPSDSKINYMLLPTSIIKFNLILTKLINSSVLYNSVLTKNLVDIADIVLKSYNFKLNIIDNTNNNPIKIIDNKITWLNNEDQDKLIFISNHSHDADIIILFYLLQCGLVASDNMNSSYIGKLISHKCNFLVCKDRIDIDIITQIKEYLDKMKKIIIFPEGIISSNETIIRFRNEAFQLNTPICPIVIKWKDYVYDDDITQYIFKSITQNEINVDIYVNDIFYPPFDQEKIDSIRDYMAQIGNLEKSRIFNRSMKFE